MIRVESIDEVGITCRLLEYNNMKALLPMTEVSKKRLRSIRKVINVDNVKVLQVLRAENDYVDLSKKIVDVEAIEQGTEKYEKGKHVISIIRQLAEITHRPLDQLCDEILWPLYSQYDEEDGPHPYHIFKRWTFEDSSETVDISEEMKESLKKIVRQRISSKELKIGAMIELTCYTFEGIDAIKAAIKATLIDFPEVKIQYLSAPTYQIWTTGVNEQELITRITAFIDRISTEIIKGGGECKVVTAPSSLTKQEDDSDDD